MGNGSAILCRQFHQCPLATSDQFLHALADLKLCLHVVTFLCVPPDPLVLHWWNARGMDTHLHFNMKCVNAGRCAKWLRE